MVIALPALDDIRLGPIHHDWSAPPIALLPKQIDYDSLVSRNAAGVVLGLEDAELRTVTIDFRQQRHLLIIGDNECGKTATLRTVCRGLLRTTDPTECQILIVDVRRSLLDFVESEPTRLGGYLPSVHAIGEAMPRLIAELRRRTPPADVTPTQLRTRSWWTGPEIYVLVDDFELVSDMLAPFAELLPHAQDLGFHLVLARRSGGSARAMFEPLLARLRDAGCLTLLMSASPDEGLTIDSVRQSPMPPGRGTLLSHRIAPQMVQVAWTPPA